jgi:hypothetical protein
MSDLISSHVLQIHCQINVIRNQNSRQLGQLVHDEVGLGAGRDEGSLENDSSEETSVSENGSNRNQTTHRMAEHEARQIRILKLKMRNKKKIIDRIKIRTQKFNYKRTLREPIIIM